MRAACVTLVAMALAVFPTAEGSAGEVLACWSGSVPDSVTGDPTSVTVCSIEGSSDEFVLEAGTALSFQPNVGYDLAGTQCWFWTTADTSWVILTISGNTATLGWQPPGSPGGPIAVDVTAPACTSRPQGTVSDVAAVWRLIEEYVHQEPNPILDPPVGLGLTGLDTFAAVTPPDPFNGSLISPGTGAVLEVHAEVSAVTVRWGDGTDPDTFTSVLFPRLTTSPDGVASHVFEVKTCTPPGGTRCHPELGSYPITVSYEWTARWRAAGSGDWLLLTVPDTESAVAYPVGEVVSVLTGNG